MLSIVSSTEFPSNQFLCNAQHRYYANQKKTLEINPGHPLVKELLKRVEENKEDKAAKDMARLLFETATLRSGYIIKVLNPDLFFFFAK